MALIAASLTNHVTIMPAMNAPICEAATVMTEANRKLRKACPTRYDFLFIGSIFFERDSQAQDVTAVGIAIFSTVA